MLPTQPYRRGVCAAATTLVLLCASAAPQASAQNLQPAPSGQPVSPPSTLPPTPPTSLPTSSSAPSSITAAPAPAPNPPHYAHVTFNNDQLEIHADDSSLNQILRSISHLTGLKITGGVQDQRVYGAYGPAPAATVLATLLDGTGTNILLLEGSATTPPRLILTPRSGGAAPPSPDSPIYAAYDNPNYNPSATSATQQPSPSQAPSQSAPQSIPLPANNVNGSASNSSPTASTMPTTHSVSLDSIPSPSTTPSTPGIVDSPNPPAPGSTSATTPGNSPLTPQMVAQKLLQMHQQQQAAQPQPPASAAQPH